MKRTLQMMAACAALSVSSVSTVSAQSQPARVVVVHGIPGGAVGAAADLPVVAAFRALSSAP